MILLDTNVVSELMRPKPDTRVHVWLSGLAAESLATTTITVAEITYGLERLNAGVRRTRLAERFAGLVGAAGLLPALELDEAAADAAGQFRAMRETQGLHATLADMLIAGVAATLSAELATRNGSDFAGLPISVVDPWA